MIDVLVGAGVGLIAGPVVREAAKRIPVFLFKTWRIEARQTLELDDQEISPDVVQPKRHILQRAFIPEIACVLLSAVVLSTFGMTLQSVAMLVLTWGLVALVLIDAEHQLLPDILVLPLLWIGLIVNQQSMFTRLDDALFGAVAGYMVLWLVLTGFKVITRRDGMGHGDLKMLAMLGAWGGLHLLSLIILVSSISGAIYGIGARQCNATVSGAQMPFGPFLALGGFVAMIWGDTIITDYLR